MADVTPALQILTSPQTIAKPFVHGFPTRLGGVSTEPHLRSLNLINKKPDNLDNVNENLRRLGECIGMPVSSLHRARCNHTTNVFVVGESKTSANPTGDYDAVITNVPGTWAGAFHADCCPVLIADPVRTSCAAIHSGREGTKGKIVKNAVNKMIAEYGSDPKDLRVCIGPTIRGCCYKLTPEIVEKFCAEFSDTTGFVFPDPEQPRLDIVPAVIATLVEVGVPLANIDKSCAFCTACDPERFFSYRRDKTGFGNHMSFIGIAKG